jgi:hypothetical protein
MWLPGTGGRPAPHVNAEDVELITARAPTASKYCRSGDEEAGDHDERSESSACRPEALSGDSQNNCTPVLPIARESPPERPEAPDEAR